MILLLLLIFGHRIPSLVYLLHALRDEGVRIFIIIQIFLRLYGSPCYWGILSNKFYFHECISMLVIMSIPTLILPDYPMEKIGLVLAGCHDRSKSNHHLEKKKKKQTLCNQ